MSDFRKTGSRKEENVPVTPELAAQINDTISYAHLSIVVGNDPDHPDRVVSQLVTVPGSTPVCYLKAAVVLRDMADHLDALHEQSGCNE